MKCREIHFLSPRLSFVFLCFAEDGDLAASDLLATHKGQVGGGLHLGLKTRNEWKGMPLFFFFIYALFSLLFKIHFFFLGLFFSFVFL